MNKHKIYTKCFECGFMEANNLSDFSVTLMKDNEIVASKKCKNCGEMMHLFFGDMYRAGVQEFILKEAFVRWERWKNRKNRRREK